MRLIRKTLNTHIYYDKLLERDSFAQHTSFVHTIA